MVGWGLLWGVDSLVCGHFLFRLLACISFFHLWRVGILLRERVGVAGELSSLLLQRKWT